MQFNFRSLLAVLLPLAGVAQACVIFQVTIVDNGYLIDGSLTDDGPLRCWANEVKTWSCDPNYSVSMDDDANVHYTRPGAPTFIFPTQVSGDAEEDGEVFTYTASEYNC